MCRLFVGIVLTSQTVIDTYSLDEPLTCMGVVRNSAIAYETALKCSVCVGRDRMWQVDLKANP
jgi:hypothetical protein